MKIGSLDDPRWVYLRVMRRSRKLSVVGLAGIGACDDFEPRFLEFGQLPPFAFLILVPPKDDVGGWNTIDKTRKSTRSPEASHAVSISIKDVR